MTKLMGMNTFFKRKFLQFVVHQIALDIGTDTPHFNIRFPVKTEEGNHTFVHGGICKLDDVSQLSGCIIDFE